MNVTPLWLKPQHAAVFNQLEDEKVEWGAKAACRVENARQYLTAFYDSNYKEQCALAVQVCAQCPVRKPCLTYAIASKQREGLWGGIPDRYRHPYHAQIYKKFPSESHLYNLDAIETVVDKALKVKPADWRDSRKRGPQAKWFTLEVIAHDDEDQEVA